MHEAANIRLFRSSRAGHVEHGNAVLVDERQEGTRAVVHCGAAPTAGRNEGGGLRVARLRESHALSTARNTAGCANDSSFSPQAARFTSAPMCGRYRLTKAELYAELNDVLLGGGALPPRFHIAPCLHDP
jgi:hypothetical protein